jgi:hypothetical protein
MKKAERPAQFGDVLLLDLRDAFAATRYALAELEVSVAQKLLGVRPPPWMGTPRAYRLDGWMGLDTQGTLDMLARLNALLESERISHEVWEA